MPRRGFLEAPGRTALPCSIGGKPLEEATPPDVERADTFAATIHPHGVKYSPRYRRSVESLSAWLLRRLVSATRREAAWDS